MYRDRSVKLRDEAAKQALVRSRAVRKYAGTIAVGCHEEGVEFAARGDVDRAYQRLNFARRCYALSEPPVPGRRLGELGVSCDTDDALKSAFCPDCRSTLDSPESFALHTALRSALSPVSRDLAWFESCCDDCYRLVWDALSRARLGFEIDAFKAWWLSHNVRLGDPETPLSRGRFIAALTEVQRRRFSDQLERMRYCDLALADAVGLGDPHLEAEARIWRGNGLRAMARFPEARAEFAKAAPVARTTPWLAALQTRMEGILAENTNDYPSALYLLRSATKDYEVLDRHTAGLLVIQQANVHFSQAKYEESIDLDRRSRAYLDDRRDPLLTNATVPIHLALSFACLEQWDEAESALAECRFDRKLERGAAAAEAFNRACVSLGRGRPAKALRQFSEAKERFEDLHQPRDVALTVSYSVEAYARLGDRDKAIRSAGVALRFFEAAGCHRDTLEAVGKLQALLEAEVIDTVAVTTHVRDLGLKHGGWLPAPKAG